MKRKPLLYAAMLSLTISGIDSINAQSVAVNTDGTTAHSIIGKEMMIL